MKRRTFVTLATVGATGGIAMIARNAFSPDAEIEHPPLQTIEESGVQYLVYHATEVISDNGGLVMFNRGLHGQIFYKGDIESQIDGRDVTLTYSFDITTISGERNIRVASSEEFEYEGRTWEKRNGIDMLVDTDMDDKQIEGVRSLHLQTGNYLLDPKSGEKIDGRSHGRNLEKVRGMFILPTNTDEAFPNTVPLSEGAYKTLGQRVLDSYQAHLIG